MWNMPWTGKLLAGILAIASVGLTGCNDNLKAERDALYAQNQELQSQLNTTRTALEAAEADRARLVEELAQAEAAPPPAPVEAAANPFEGIGGVEVEQGGGQVTVRVPGDVLFDPGKAVLRSQAKKTLNEIAGVLNNSYSGKTVRIEGYTDPDPIRKSKWADNLELSAERAMSVQRYLAERGVPSDRMYSAGFGSAKPRATKSKSRRVEIVVVQ